MQSKEPSFIISGFLGRFIGDLQDVGFSHKDLLTALRAAVQGMEAVEPRADAEDDLDSIVNRIEKSLAEMGFRRVPMDGGCPCHICVARRRRGADPKRESTDL